MPTSDGDDKLVRAMVRAARRREYAGWFVLVSQIVAVIALMVMTLVGITGGVLTWQQRGSAAAGKDLIESFVNSLGVFVILMFFILLAAASYVALLIVPFLIALPVTLPLAARDRDVVALLGERITRPRYPEQPRWAIDELGKYPAAVAARGPAGAPGARDGQLRLEEATALANHRAMDVLNRALASGVNEAAFGLDSLVVQDNVDAFRSALAAPDVAVRRFAAHALLARWVVLP